MKIVVIGGSGLIGRNVVSRLVAQRHDPVSSSPATGVDTITGEGLAEVVVGADVVVDVSNAPVWDDDAVMQFFTTSTRICWRPSATQASATTSRCRSSAATACPTAATSAPRSAKKPRSRLGHARYYGTELHGGELTPGEGARIGKVEFDTWFAANQQEAR